MKKTSRTPRRRPAAHAPLDNVQLHAVTTIFATLSEVSRLQILQILQAGPATGGELVERTGLKQANASKQLGILLSAGIIARRQEGNHAIFSIQLPLVFKLCHLVCRGVARQTAERAAALSAPAHPGDRASPNPAIAARHMR